jgi:twinkle protein
MNAQEIKSALNERGEEFAQWLFPAGRKEGHEWKVGSLQGEKGNSLGICIEGSKIGVFCDFATSEKGDNLLELYMQAMEVVSFKDALRACADWLGVPITRSEPPQQAQQMVTPADPFPSEFDLLSVEQYQEALRMIGTLMENPNLCERIARARGWKVETVQELTKEPSLGWHDGKLAFIYETGVKLRWRQAHERMIRWAFGKPWIWRGGFLTEADTVYLCEGETDAISLIDAGVEQRPKTFAVALPSASTFDARWAESFRGKEVILVLDADKAGSEATAKVSKLLYGCTRSLKQLNWGAVQYASAS